MGKQLIITPAKLKRIAKRIEKYPNQLTNEELAIIQFVRQTEKEESKDE